MSDKSVLELINDVTEFNDLHDLMKDEQLDRALAIVIKLIMNPDIPSAKAPMLIIELQAISAKLAVLAAYYTTFGRDKSNTLNYNKKNIYYKFRCSLSGWCSNYKS